MKIKIRQNKLFKSSTASLTKNLSQPNASETHLLSPIEAQYSSSLIRITTEKYFHKH
jgi:hypothetical protein